MLNCQNEVAMSLPAVWHCNLTALAHTYVRIIMLIATFTRTDTEHKVNVAYIYVYLAS